MVELVPSLLRQELNRLAADGQRIDGRGQFDGRDVHLEVDCLYNAEGSAKVVWGDTIIYAGVKFEIRTPWPIDQHRVHSCVEQNCVLLLIESMNLDHPHQNPSNSVASWTVEFVNLVALTWGLCIVPGEKVWGVMIDIHVLSDGVASSTPQGSQPLLLYVLLLFQQNDLMLVKITPLRSMERRLASFKRAGGRFVYDPSEEEELGGDERIHITLGDEGHLPRYRRG